MERRASLHIDRNHVHVVPEEGALVPVESSAVVSTVDEASDTGRIIPLTLSSLSAGAQCGVHAGAGPRPASSYALSPARLRRQTRARRDGRRRAALQPAGGSGKARGKRLQFQTSAIGACPD